MGHDVRPPGVARRLLSLIDRSGAVRGDLDEEFERHILPGQGARRARMWYWNQTVRSLPVLCVRRWRRERAQGGWLRRWHTDLGAAVRAVVRRPGYSVLAAATFAIAMSTNTAVFSIVHGVILRPLPYAEADRMVRIRPDALFYTSLEDARRFAARADAFDRVAAWGRTLFTFVADGESEEVRGAQVEWHHFETLGVRPFLGRTFNAADALSPGRALVISHGLWLRRFGGDGTVVGRQISLRDSTATIVGVLPAGHVPMEPDWLAWSVLPADAGASENPLAMNARLKPGTSRAQGLVSARAAFRAMHADEGDSLTEGEVLALTVIPLRDHLLGQYSRPLLVLLGAVVFLLLLACANVMHLLLAQGAAREAEFALRLALGAGPRRVFVQLLAEVMVVAGAGALNGLWIAWLALQWAASRLPADLPRAPAIGLDLPVLLYSAAAMVLAGLLAGVVPAMRVARRSLSGSLSGATSRVASDNRRITGGLVAAEVTVSVVLVIGAGLMIRSVVALKSVHPGFDAASAVAVRVVPAAGRYPDASGLDAFYARIREAAVRSPFITEAGAIMFLPMTPGGATSRYQVAGSVPVPDDELPRTSFRIVTPGYFDAMRIAVRAGRVITPEDRANSAAVAVVNETLARAGFRGADPVGRVLRLGVGDEARALTVVGVVADVRQSDLRRSAQPELYLPQSQEGFARMYVVARSNGPGREDLSGALGALRAAVHDVDPTALVSGSMRVDAVLAGSLASTRFMAEILGLFGLVALLLGASGVYGVTAHAVSRRRREIGIRIALGADRTGVAVRTFLDGMAPVGLGLLCGVGFALLGARVLQSLLYEVTPADPLTLVMAPALLAATGALALAVPAMRASRVDPIRSLRDD